MKANLVRYEAGPIARITLDDPPMNLLRPKIVVQLGAKIDEALADEHVRAIVLTGAGKRAFTAGFDIKVFTEIEGASAAEHLARAGQAITIAIESASKPVIAAINGLCLGGGNELAMACHFRIATSNARFGQPEIKLGLIPGFGGTQRLPRLIKRNEALRLILTGETITADQAHCLGLVDEVVDDADLPHAVDRLASQFVASSRTAVAAALVAWRHSEGDLQAGLAAEAKLFGSAMDSADAREGIGAFLDKRRPNFTTQP